jgi:hypothetical protein
LSDSRLVQNNVRQCGGHLTCGSGPAIFAIYPPFFRLNEPNIF